MSPPNDNGTARSLLEIALGFIGVLLVLPLLFRAVAGLFRLGLVRRLIGEAVFVGITTLLTREGVLDRLFGQKGQTGDALLKPRVSE
jgi:hypothetical protein